MSGSCLSTPETFIIYYVSVPETLVLGLMIWGVITWLRTRKAIEASPIGTLFSGVKKGIESTARPETPEEKDMLPPP